MQTCNAGASQQIDEKCFDRIVAMVSGGDTGISFFMQQPGKESITFLAGFFFNTQFVACCHLACVKLSHITFDFVVLCQLTDKGFITVTVARTQVEIAVGDGERITRRMHEMAQRDRIATSTNSKQHLLPGGKEVLLCNII